MAVLDRPPNATEPRIVVPARIWNFVLLVHNSLWKNFSKSMMSIDSIMLCGTYCLVRTKDTNCQMS